MLPALHQQRYQTLKQRIQVLQDADDRAEIWQAAAIQVAISALQTDVQREIFSLEADVLDARLAHHLQAVQVEIDKQLRLLHMDSQFLQVARSSTTENQRRQQMRARLLLLLRYCDAVLGC